MTFYFNLFSTTPPLPTPVNVTLHHGSLKPITLVYKFPQL